MAEQGGFDGGFDGYDDGDGYGDGQEQGRGAGAVAALDAYGRGVNDGHGVQAMLQEAMAPLTAQVTDMQITRHAEALEAQFPALADNGTAEAFVNAAAGYAAALGVDFEAAKLNPSFMHAAAVAFLGDGQGADQHAGGGPSIPDQIKAVRGGNSFWGT